MAANTGDVSLPAASSTAAVATPSITAAPHQVTAAPPVAAESPAVAVAARSEGQDPPQEEKTSAAPADRPAVLPDRPARHHVRARHSCAHRPAHVQRRAAQPRAATPRAQVWFAAPSAPQCSGHCWQLVLLGVGY
jgi:hypothetical protein